jgi:hypothetical protein
MLHVQVDEEHGAWPSKRRGSHSDSEGSGSTSDDEEAEELDGSLDALLASTYAGLHSSVA